MDEYIGPSEAFVATCVVLDCGEASDDRPTPLEAVQVALGAGWTAWDGHTYCPAHSWSDN